MDMSEPLLEVRDLSVAFSGADDQVVRVSGSALEPRQVDPRLERLFAAFAGRSEGRAA